jgi:hypothetical protein
MAADGPPWITGQNCNVSLQQAGVNGGVAAGFYVKPDTYRVSLPKVWYPGTNVRGIAGVTSPIGAGKRVIECVVLCRSGLLHVDGVPTLLTAAQWHNRLLAFAALNNTPLTLVDPEGLSWAVGVEEMEDRWSPLGGQFLLEWEVRCVLVEV